MHPLILAVTLLLAGGSDGGADVRFHTNRSGAPLVLPSEEDAFFFVVFGDRTGGPAEGVRVLADAVRDVNLLEPDLVMTVGDLIQGYNRTDEWLPQMEEFKGIMNDLVCPWFPVAGNHDVYWRGNGEPPVGEHEGNYELHFGPLWYAFEHKDCWFVVLYSDEGDPVTGRKTFSAPAAQVMSDAQLSWLRGIMTQARSAQHVFVFLHHPRWIGGGYGRDWDRVHTVLREAGNVRAVFAGHIHHMRYDGPRDGIEYVTLATTGGSQSGVAPEAGYLHHFNVVTVREDHIALAALPVGEIMDVRAITADVSRDTAKLAGLRPRFDRRLPVDRRGHADGILRATLVNPVGRPIELTLIPDSDDSRWQMTPDHRHLRLEPSASVDVTFRVARAGGEGLDDAFALPELRQQIDYLAPTARFPVVEMRVPIALAVELPPPPVPPTEQVLVLDGRGHYLEVPSDLLDVPDGSLTVECRFRADTFAGSSGLVAKTESSEFGLWIEEGAPVFYLFLDDRYVEVGAPRGLVEPGRWHHVAGVYDGSESRLYLDGVRVAAVVRSGVRRKNNLPLLVGADVQGAGRARAYFDGEIDGVRVSTVARYAGESFAPPQRHSPDDATALLLEMDARYGPWVYDGSGRGAHAIVRGEARLGSE